MVESSVKPMIDILTDGDPNEFICGMPKSKYFGHTRKKALVIGCSDYAALREIEGKEKYGDLVETINDVKNVVSGLKRLGFEDANITILKEPNWNELHLNVIELAGDIHKTSQQGERTLIFIYYAGHGMSDNNLQVQLN